MQSLLGCSFCTEEGGGPPRGVEGEGSQVASDASRQRQLRRAVAQKHRAWDNRGEEILWPTGETPMQELLSDSLTSSGVPPSSWFRRYRRSSVTNPAAMIGRGSIIGQ